jgi:hypothetical protein
MLQGLLDSWGVSYHSDYIWSDLAGSVHFHFNEQQDAIKRRVYLVSDLEFPTAEDCRVSIAQNSGAERNRSMPARFYLLGNKDPFAEGMYARACLESLLEAGYYKAE